MNKQINTENNVNSGARMAGEERRGQIVQVAMSLFSEHGFRGTTTKEIAHAAGISEAMVFRHFATKEELYAAILDHKACSSGGQFDPCELMGEAVSRKDDRAIFEGLAFSALEYHEEDPDFQRLLLHSALEKHQLSKMFFDQFVLKVYEFLCSYIRERQRDGAFIEMDPAIVVRAFIGMVMHHSLNNNLWDPGQRLLKVSNEEAARCFTDILLNGITAPLSKSTDSTVVEAGN
ncbi:MAG TPA: TetR/AcrR family transcriptional regulator [Pyrinomonadaceae bacterium]